MAPKRSSLLEDPPAASSSEEEVESEEVESEEVESEKESDEEDKSEQKQEPKKATTTTSPSIPPPTPAVNKIPSKKPETQPQSSSSDEGSDSGSDSDSDHPPPGVADPNVRPISSIPMEVASNLKKPRSKSVSAAAASTTSVAATPTKSTGKRPVDNGSGGGEGTDSKRAKNSAAAGEDSKRPMFQRLWSEEDEIVILKGMIDYSAKKGSDPFAEMGAFHEFIKKSLHIDVMSRQLMHKMRRMKKKYVNNAKKGKNGEDRTFKNPHERKAYDLSKIIWGKEAINGGGAQQAKANSKSNGKAKKSDLPLTPTEKEELLVSLRAPKVEPPPKKDTVGQQNVGHSEASNHSVLLNGSIVSAGLDSSFVKEGLALIPAAKRSELEEKWRKLQLAEMEIFLRRADLVREQTQLVYDAYKKQ